MENGSEGASKGGEGVGSARKLGRERGGYHPRCGSATKVQRKCNEET